MIMMNVTKRLHKLMVMKVLYAIQNRHEIRYPEWVKTVRGLDNERENTNK